MPPTADEAQHRDCKDPAVLYRAKMAIHHCQYCQHGQVELVLGKRRGGGMGVRGEDTVRPKMCLETTGALAVLLLQ